MKIKLLILFLFAASFVKSQDTIFKNTSFTINSSPFTFTDLVMEDNSSIIISSELRDVEIHMHRAIIGKNCSITAKPKHGKRAPAQTNIPAKSSKCSDGKDGIEGIQGENGFNGCNIKLIIGIIEIGNLLFISHGGNGGYGGVGGKGGDGGDSDSFCSCHTTGGRGGPGGKGGKGGDGGKFTVEYWVLNPRMTYKKSDLLNEIFSRDNEKGYGEQGGEGGQGGLGNPEKDCGVIKTGGGPRGGIGIDNSNKWNMNGKDGPEIKLIRR